MLFNSFEFIFVFLPLIVGVYFFLTGKRLLLAAKTWLAAASLFFYAWWNLSYVAILLGSIFFNFAVGNALLKQEKMRVKLPRVRVLQVGLAANIALLAYFKYTDFFLTGVNAALGTQYPLLHLVLPLGISFFTITQITFLVDCYEGLVEETDFLNYLLFVTFFPHLLMGPILHHKQILPQLERLRNAVFQADNLMRGLALFSMGLAKKILLADQFALWAKQGFGSIGALATADAWAVSLAYTLQLYFDFSGYTDMALGIALLFNVRLPLNFNTPFKARSVIDFWQRWHMSLTRFITTYIYSAILKSFRRITFQASMIATFLALLTAGFWHDAKWGYLLFYFCHALALVINHWWKRKKILKIPAVVSWLLTFLFFNCTLLLFRAADLQDAGLMASKMLGVNAAAAFGTLGGDWQTWAALAFGLLLAVRGLNSQELMERLRPNWLSACLIAALLVLSCLRLNQVSEFLYFNF